MSGAIFAVIGLAIGVMILGSGLYYLIKEKDNREFRKIYGVTCLIGVLIIIGIFIKMVYAGF